MPHKYQWKMKIWLTEASSKAFDLFSQKHNLLNNYSQVSIGEQLRQNPTGHVSVMLRPQHCFPISNHTTDNGGRFALQTFWNRQGYQPVDIFKKKKTLTNKHCVFLHYRQKQHMVLQETMWRTISWLDPITGVTAVTTRLQKIAAKYIKLTREL